MITYQIQYRTKSNNYWIDYDNPYKSYVEICDKFRSLLADPKDLNATEFRILETCTKVTTEEIKRLPVFSKNN